MLLRPLASTPSTCLKALKTAERNVAITVKQFVCGDSHKAGADKVEKLVRKAVNQGANIVLLRELFDSVWFWPDLAE